MKKQLLFVGIFLLTSGFSFGQSNHETPSAIKKSPVLTELSNKIQAKESAALTSSRAGAAAANSELKDLYKNYSDAISEQIKKTSSETELKELSQELRYAEKKKAELTSTTR